AGSAAAPRGFPHSGFYAAQSAQSKTANRAAASRCASSLSGPETGGGTGRRARHCSRPGTRLRRVARRAPVRESCRCRA
nr:hypothetical protein [Tanacetum cinerariifolium]